MNFRVQKLLLMVAVVTILHRNAAAQQNDAAIADSSTEAASIDTSQAIADDVADTVVLSSDFRIPHDSVHAWSQGNEFGYLTYIDSVLKSRKGLLRMDTIGIGGRGATDREETSRASSSSLNFLNSKPVKIFFWLMAISFILVLLYRLFFSQGGFFRRKPRWKEEHSGGDSLELNDYEAYHGLIEQAEAKGDLNLAARYLYLQTLKKLSDARLIQFSPEKTDDQYVAELSGRNFQGEFNDLAMNYEYIWYGRFAISPEYYARLKEQFGSLNQKL